MNAVHDPNIELLERIHRFVVAGESNELTDAQWAEFEQFLWENDDACRLYVEFNGVSALLPAVMDALPDKDVFVPSWEQPRNDFSIPGLLANAFHGTVGYFSQEIPFSLLVATVVTSLGLLIGSLVYVTHHEPSVQTATNSLPTFRQPLDTKLSTNANVVGRITGTYKCQWNGPGSTGQGTEKATRNFLVTLGDKIVLASGLLEITYDTGAKVILQGPIAYDVDSRDGGFLAIGKLTAR